MISLNKFKLLFFFFIVSCIYIFTPLISVAFFYEDIKGVFTFTVVSLLLVLFCIPVFLVGGHIIKIDLPFLSEGRLLFFGMFFFASFISCLLTIYGSFEAALLSSYTSRTGVELSGLFTYIYNPLLSFSVTYVSLVLVWLFERRVGSVWRKTFLLFLACSFILVFMISGNRNLILWSISVPLAIFVGKAPIWKTFLLVSFMVFASFLMAAFRNQGIGGIANFSFPPLEYWNPIVHEFGTAYRVYDLIVNGGVVIGGFEYPFQSYLNGLYNLVPSVAKPSGYESFSTAISSQFASNGEGLGNSPVAEVIYNWYFPAFFVQTLPIVLMVFLASWKRKRRWRFRGRVQTTLVYTRLSALGALVIASFNFWRIGFSELFKIEMSFIFAFVVCGLVLSKQPSRKI